MEQRVSEYSAKPPTKDYVDKKIDGRVEDHEDLASDVQADEVHREETAVEVSIDEGHALEYEFRGLADDEDDDDDEEDDGGTPVVAAHTSCRSHRLRMQTTQGPLLASRRHVNLSCSLS